MMNEARIRPSYAEQQRVTRCYHMNISRMCPERLPEITPSLVVVVVLTLTRIIKSVDTGQAPVTLELRNIPGGTRIYHS